MTVSTKRPRGAALMGVLFVSTALAVQSCAIPTSTFHLGSRQQPVLVTVTPAVVKPGRSAQVSISSPSADSIAIESANGLDRYWRAGAELDASIASSFGDSTAEVRYAVRSEGRLLDVLKKPMKVAVCRKRICREYYHELSVQLPERNERSVAVTGGWSTVFTRRAVTGPNRAVLLNEALSHGVWNIQGELAAPGLNARLQGYYGSQERGGALDLSREIARAEDGLSYGLALHLSATHSTWLPVAGMSSSLAEGSTAYRASVGPSIMIRGLTASSQFGIYTDGRETLEELSTFLSLNGRLTEIRQPVTVTLMKTFAFGRGPIIPRRRDQLERMTVDLDLIQDVAIRIGMTTHRSAWPIQDRATDFSAKEVYYTIGVQYTLGW